MKYRTLFYDRDEPDKPCLYVHTDVVLRRGEFFTYRWDDPDNSKGTFYEPHELAANKFFSERRTLWCVDRVQRTLEEIGPVGAQTWTVHVYLEHKGPA